MASNARASQLRHCLSYVGRQTVQTWAYLDPALWLVELYTYLRSFEYLLFSFVRLLASSIDCSFFRYSFPNIRTLYRGVIRSSSHYHHRHHQSTNTMQSKRYQCHPLSPQFINQFIISFDSRKRRKENNISSYRHIIEVIKVVITCQWGVGLFFVVIFSCFSRFSFLVLFSSLSFAHSEEQLVSVSKSASRNPLTTIMMITSHQSRTVVTLRTAPSTPTPTTNRSRVTLIMVRSSVSGRNSMTPTPSPNRNGHPLQDSAVVMTSRIHAVVHREIPANQIRAHGSVLAGHYFRLADWVGLVFAVIHADYAGEARGALEGVIVWFWPVSAFAEACYCQSVHAMQPLALSRKSTRDDERRNILAR